MGFKGYKLKHKLIVLQSFQDDASDTASDYATSYDIVLFISSTRSGVIRFNEMEDIIKRTLGRFSDRSLVEIRPFDELEPTLENLGHVLYQLLKQNLARIETSLEMLEISESPIKTYIVNEANTYEKLFVGDKKIKISSLLVENIISQSIAHMVSEFEAPEEETNSVEPAPQPESEPQDDNDLRHQAPAVCYTNLTETKKVPLYKFLFSVLLLAGVGALLAMYLNNTGAYPSGADIYGHLFKSDLLYHSIKDGDYFPLYTDLWYNGIQPYRYWAPLPYYLLAMLQFLAGGDPYSSYLLFAAFAVVAGGIGWLIWGMAYNRLGFCTFLGVLWFFMPDNMRVFFVEGNLPRMVIAILLPYLFFFIWRFVEHCRQRAIIPMILVMCMITLCHAMIAAMTGVTTFVFLLIYSINQKRLRESKYVIIGMLLSFALCGIWLYPALKGGLVGMDAAATAEVMKALSTPIVISLNPILRNVGMYELFYFGASILALSIIGLLLADKKSRIGFYTVIIIFCGTTTAFVPFLEKLPLNQVFWMVRFTPIVYAIFILSLLEWKKSRRYTLIIVAMILVLDCIPSLDLQRYHSQTPSTFRYTLDHAKEITKQRVSLLDVSAYGSYPSFGLTVEEPKMQYTFGWAWQAAATASNIVMINTALEKGYYYYMFDRCIELGDDTVLVRKELLKQAKKTLSSLVEAAEASGYRLVKETNYTYLFHKNTPRNFGVVTDYAGLAIGRNARSIALEYPGFGEGDYQNLTHYTVDELSRYKVLYLSGFMYNDRKKAEDLLTQVANKGVRIIIDMNQIPVDPITSRMTFFDVTAQSITFSNRYPELMYRNKIYDAIPFKEENAIWNTVYLENVKNIQGYSWFQNKQLAFIGTGDNKNIYFMGYNFLYHAMETNDQAILSLMSDLLEIDPNQLPERKVVPLKIKYQEDKITIDAPEGNINTTLAYQDNFLSDQRITEVNNLLEVTEPHTEIRMRYPYLMEGLAVSVTGLLGIVIMLYVLTGRRGVRNEKKNN